MALEFAHGEEWICCICTSWLRSRSKNPLLGMIELVIIEESKEIGIYMKISLVQSWHASLSVLLHQISSGAVHAKWFLFDTIIGAANERNSQNLRAQDSGPFLDKSKPHHQLNGDRE